MHDQISLPFGQPLDMLGRYVQEQKNKMKENILKYTEDYIDANSSEEYDNLQSVLNFSNITEKAQHVFHNKVIEKACLNIHFHPDRISNNILVIDSLIESGEYKNQFQTNISSGSLTAKIGGDRDVWENKLFNNLLGKNTEQRPKYASLNLTFRNDGASPRFGSCYFITSPYIKSNSTFTYGDSYLLPKERGTANNLTQIYSRLYTDILTRNKALGVNYESINDFMAKTLNFLDSKELWGGNSNNLDFYVEAQIHDKINLKDDITFLVVDYSFKNTEFEDKFNRLCSKHDISLIWNDGYQLRIKDIPDNFRGIRTQIFAGEIAEKDTINAYILGKAITNERLKLDFVELEYFQLLKYVWHCLVKFGSPIKPIISTK